MNIVIILQIGVTNALRLPGASMEEFFFPIEPKGAKGQNLHSRHCTKCLKCKLFPDCLDHFKLEGDLLRALHMTEVSQLKTILYF